MDPWYDPMERGTVWSYRGSRQAHGVVHLGIEDVKTTSAVHEHLGHVCLADNRVDDERELAYLWNAVRVVGPIEGDHAL